MPCNAVATIKAKINLPTEVDEAIKSYTMDQAKALFTALLIEGTKFTPANVTYDDYMRFATISCGSIRITIYRTADQKAISYVKIEDLYDDYPPAEFAAKIARINQAIIKGAGLIANAQAIAKIKAAMKITSEQKAPNGATILNIEI